MTVVAQSLLVSRGGRPSAKLRLMTSSAPRRAIQRVHSSKRWGFLGTVWVRNVIADVDAATSSRSELPLRDSSVVMIASMIASRVSAFSACLAAASSMSTAVPGGTPASSHGEPFTSESTRAGSNSDITLEANKPIVALSVISSVNSSRAALSTFGWRASTSPRGIGPICCNASARALQATKRLFA